MAYFFLFLFLLGCNFDFSPTKYPSPDSKGDIVISTEILKSKTIYLQNQWEFYWGELLTPHDFEMSRELTIPIYLSPGMNWKNAMKDNVRLSGKGYATYRMILNLPLEEVGKLYGIKFYQTGGPAQHIFLQGESVLELGKVGTSKDSMIPTRKSGIVHFVVLSPRVEIIVQISNFHHDDGAFWYAPKFGKEKILSIEIKKGTIIEATLLGGIFVISFYQFIMYFKRKKDLSTLVFGFFCVFILLHSIAMRGDFLYDFFPEIPYRLTFLLSLIFLLYVPCYIYFLSLIYPKEFSNRFLFVSWILNVLPFVLIIFLPTEIGSIFTITGLISVITFSVIVLVKLGICYLNRVEYTGLLFISQFVYVSSGIIDSFSTYRIIDTPYLHLYSYFFYTLVQSIILTDKYSNIYLKLEQVSLDLKRNNESLEETVQLRTLQYKREKEKSENESLWKDKFISLVSHDLQSPLTSLLFLHESMLGSKDNRESLEEKILNSKYIILNSLSMVKHLLCMSRFQYSCVSLLYRDVSLHETFDYITNELKGNLYRKKIRLVLDNKEDIILTLDEDIFKEILRNIVLNSIKFSHENSEIRLSFREDKIHQSIVVQDNGVGFSEEIIRKIRERVQISTSGTKGESGFGVGLRLCCDLMRLHKGSLEIEPLDQGTRVLLQFPSNAKTLLYYFSSDKEFRHLEKFMKLSYLCIQANCNENVLHSLEEVHIQNVFLSLHFSDFVLENLLSELLKLDLTSVSIFYLCGSKEKYKTYSAILSNVAQYSTFQHIEE